MAALAAAPTIVSKARADVLLPRLDGITHDSLIALNGIKIASRTGLAPSKRHHVAGGGDRRARLRRSRATASATKALHIGCDVA